jgi:hypothetical protein
LPAPRADISSGKESDVLSSPEPTSHNRDAVLR